MPQELSRNAWRQKTPGNVAWAERLKAGAANKYFVMSCDTHVNEPFNFLDGRIDDAFKDRLPSIRKDEDGTQWLITDGWEPQLVSVPPERSDLLPDREAFESYDVMSPYTEKMEHEDMMRTSSGRSVDQRLEHALIDGVDAEIIFPNKGLLAFATPDNNLADAMSRGYNRWAIEYFSGHLDRMLPMALIAPGNVENAVKEVQWAAANGFKGLEMPSRPIFSRHHEPRSPIHYSHRMFEPLWAAIEETGLPITYHIATGEDPRAVKGGGASLIAYTGAMSTAIEPVFHMIASGVFERYPKIKIATIETNVGWMPNLANTMDHGWKAQHMWQRPELPRPPSEYLKQNCYSTLLEDAAILPAVVELGYEDNILWSNDYPHHEGSFPHSAANIQRQLEKLTEEQRTKILGLNAAKLFGIEPKPRC